MSDSDDVYYTIASEITTQIKVKGSRFIGYAAPVQNEEAAHDYLLRLSKKYHDATHHCYAFQIGYGDKNIIRFSDAGEPSGTAGRPILNVITGDQLTDVICVVVRYFGGTKLGTGGLARAYGECASQTLKSAKTITKVLTQPVILSFDYNLTGQVMTVLSRLGILIENPVYDRETHLNIQVRYSKIDLLKNELIQATAGKIEIKHD